MVRIIIIDNKIEAPKTKVPGIAKRNLVTEYDRYKIGFMRTPDTLNGVGNSFFSIWKL